MVIVVLCYKSHLAAQSISCLLGGCPMQTCVKPTVRGFRDIFIKIVLCPKPSCGIGHANGLNVCDEHMRHDPSIRRCRISFSNFITMNAYLP